MQQAAWGGAEAGAESASVRARAAALGVRLATQRIMLIAVTLLAALLRLPTLGAKSLWYDELISITIARHSLAEIIRARLRFGASDAAVDQLYTNNPPLHLIVIHVTRWFSTADAAMRLPFALAGIATIPVAYLVLKRLWGPYAAAIGAILLAVAPVHISYSQEARPTVLLVLFGLLSLLWLLRGFDTGARRDWVLFAATALIGAWSSYFALILVLPTLGVIAAILLLNRYRSLAALLRSIELRAVIATLAAVGVGCLPLLPDLLAVARMNNASVGPAFSIGESIGNAGWLTVQLANPIPFGLLSGIVTSLMVLSGIVAVLRRHRFSTLIALCWVIVPTLIMISISSSHVLNARYVLASQPVVFGFAAFGGIVLLPPVLQRTRPRVVQVIQAALVGVMLIVSVQGVRAYEETFVFFGPHKPDWRGAVGAFTNEASAGSCLITLDGLGSEFSAVVPYYLERSDSPGATCAVDARDPGLSRAVADTSDLWWAFSTDRARTIQSHALIDVLETRGTVELFNFIILFHPDPQSGLAGPGALEKVLSLAVETSEPELCRTWVPAPVYREALTNVRILADRHPDEIVPLIAGFPPPMNDSDDLMWERAEDRLARGDTDGARTIATRLVALYPGDARVYDLIARIEQAAGHDSWGAYARLAAALPPTIEEMPANTVSPEARAGTWCADLT